MTFVSKRVSADLRLDEQLEAGPGGRRSPGSNGDGVLGGYLRTSGSATHVLITALLIAGGLWATFGGASINLVGQYSAVYGIAVLGQVLLIGSAGQIALSGAAFMAIGAFVTGMLATSGITAFPLPLLVSAVVGLVVGLISGLPGLRFRGLYLLLASLALLYIVNSVAQSYEQDYHQGGLAIPPLHFAGMNLSAGRGLYFTLIVILVIVYLVVAAVERTGIGLAWHSIRESEVAASIAGVDTMRWKLYAFAFSGAITAVAGSLYGYVVGLADSAAFDLTLSISLITMVFIGGVRSRAGALLGAAIITALPTLLQDNLPGWLAPLGLAKGWYASNESNVNAGIFSLLFLLVILFEPGGLEALGRRIERSVRNRRARPRNRMARSRTRETVGG